MTTESTVNRIQMLRDALENIMSPQGWWDSSGEYGRCLYCDNITTDTFYRWMALEHAEIFPVTVAAIAFLGQGTYVTDR